MRGTYRRGTRFLTPASVLAGALALVLSACSSDSEIAARKAAEATALADSGNLYAARQAAMDSVKARDDIAANWILLGRIQLASGLVGDGYVSYNRALELDASNVEAIQLVAEIALQVGRYREADKAADQVLALQPGAVRAKLIKGFVALNDGKLAVANALADEILKAEPTDDTGAVLKARALGKQGMFAEGIKLLENQLLVSKSEVVLASLSEIQRAARNGPGLASALKQLVELRPTDDRVFDLAGVLYKTGQPQAARDVLLKRLDARKDSAEFYAEATSFLVAADPGIFDARRISEIAENGSLQLRELAARVLLADNRPQDARRVLEPVINNGTGPTLRALHATARARTGEMSGVSDIIANVLRADETNIDALLLRARLRLDRGDVRGALADTALISRDSPMLIAGRMVTIDAALRRGDKRGAQRMFEQSIRAMPKNLEITESYIRYLTSEGNTARARVVAEDYTELNPYRLKGWNLLKSLCTDEECRTRADQGRWLAGTLFPADEFAGKKAPPGLYGPL